MAPPLFAAWQICWESEYCLKGKVTPCRQTWDRDAVWEFRAHLPRDPAALVNLAYDGTKEL